MKRLDDGRVSLVDFLRSIRYKRNNARKHRGDFPAHFADFSPQARAGKNSTSEERNLVRSAN